MMGTEHAINTFGRGTQKCGDPQLWFPMRVTYSREMKVKDELDRLELKNFLPMKYKVMDADTSRTMLVLKSKNDIKTVQNALNSHCFVLGDIDYVGGLEFDAVFIIGVDKGRVPPEDEELSTFVKYAWHNRMYVAVTRAKYAVKIWGNVNKGESSVLQSALAMDVIKKIEA